MRIIEHFPSGGGEYMVATHTISERAGVVSGSALLKTPNVSFNRNR